MNNKLFENYERALMSKQSNEVIVQTGGSGVGLGGLLFILFVGLKLTHYIDWSWWWVTAPLWIPPAIFFAIILLVIAAVLAFQAVLYIILGVIWMFEKLKSKRK